MTDNNEGSLWRRWDLHIHAPGTALNDQFKNWETYLAALRQAQPPAEVLGITEYCTLETYKEARLLFKQGAMPGVKYILPNVEFRLSVETKRGLGINIHLLVNPEDEDHIKRCEEALASLSAEFGETVYCTRDSLIRLGRPEHEGLISLHVERAIDLKDWCRRGEDLIDQRKTGAFRDQGSL